MNGREDDTAGTASESGLRWLEKEPEARVAPHLVLAWSLDEPHRVGETAAITAPCVLGRGPLPGAGLPRAAFLRVRPGGTEPQPAFTTQRLSRDQLRCTPRQDGVHVENIGRLQLRHNRRHVTEAIVSNGDTLVLEGAFVFLVEERPCFLPSLRAYPSEHASFAFGSSDPFGIVGESPLAWRFRDELALAAQGAGHVLLQGESGVGKELAVAAIHGLSDRARRPLVARNAATLPESLIDAELFGNSAGYPNTGTPMRPGLIGEADGSALFLDEIGELPEKHQAHLLRVLDTGEYQRLGESKSRRSNFRLYAATNRSLSRLKHDFAARFETRLAVADLNQRRSDIPLIVQRLVVRSLESSEPTFERFVKRDDGGALLPRIDPLLVESLLPLKFAHHVRELSYLLRVSASTSQGNFLKLTPEVEEALGPRGAAVEREPTREQIREALAATGGSKTEAAKLLGLKNRFALLRLLKKHG